MSDLNNSKDSSVQEKLTELSELVGWFQGAAFKLEDALGKFKQAEALAEAIEKDLTKLKNEIKVVKKKFDQTD